MYIRLSSKKYFYIRFELDVWGLKTIVCEVVRYKCMRNKGASV